MNADVTAADDRDPPLRNGGAENIPLVEWAYDKLKEMIFQQFLAPGQKLIYKDLCEKLGISRTPVINALMRLEQEGYVVSETFRGFYVKPIDIQEISDHFGIREALEVYSIEQALIGCTDADLAILQEKIDAHANYMPPVYDKKKYSLDADVHLEIARMTGNKGLVDMLTHNLEHVYLRLALSTSYPERMGPAVQEHNELLMLMRNRDAAGCVALMREHIRKGRDHVIDSLNRKEAYRSFVKGKAR